MTTQSSSRLDELELERDEADVTFWRQATPGTTYVRCLLPARYLNGQCLGLESWDLDWDHELDRMVMPRQKGVSVWQFLGDDWRSRIAFALQEQGVRVLMEVDDNYTTPHPVWPGQKVAWHPTIREATRLGGSGYSNEMHRLLVPEMDGIIVSTPYLRRTYLEYSDDVFLCPNTVDPVDWEDLEEKDPDVLRIVYSGSKSHMRDAPLVKRALKWASRQPGVEVWLQGVGKDEWLFAHKHPWTVSLSEYRRTLGRFDVGVAPLIGGEWADGKSDLKALEYAMAGVLPLLSFEEPYRPWFDRLDYLVDSSEDAWLDRIKWVVKNRDAIPELVDRARTYVLNERTTEANAWRWRKALDV